MRSGTFGLVNYRSCLNLTITDKGLYTSVLFPFRIGHKPFVVPWSDFSKIEIKKVLFFEYLKIELTHNGVTFKTSLPKSAQNKLHQLAFREV